MMKCNILGTLITACDMESVTQTVISAAREGRPLTVGAQAVHGVTTAWLDPEFGAVLNALDVVTPDGQPVRWALNWLHGAGLVERVYGPTLMLEVCRQAAREGLSIFLFGTTDAVLDSLTRSLAVRFPDLVIAGRLAPPFGDVSPITEATHREAIRASGARIVFVGLGCPRQEKWIARNRSAIGVPLLALGAAFDFLSGTKAQAPAWMQSRGLEWLFRLGSEPRRLAGRYLLLNPLYMILVTFQALGRNFPVWPAAPEQ